MTFFFQGRKEAVVSQLVLDTFTDADDTPLVNHTPDVDVVGGGWSATGSALIQGNRARLQANVTALIDAGQNNASFEVIGNKPASSSRFSLLGRGNAALTHFWEIQIVFPNLFRIQENADGSRTSRGQTAFSSSADTDYRVFATFNGQTLDAEVEGGPSLQYSSASFNENETRFGMFAGGLCHFDDFIVQ